MSARRPRLAIAAVLAFGLGVALMIPFEATLTRVGGIASLAAFVVLGLGSIAEPGFLAADREEG